MKTLFLFFIFIGIIIFVNVDPNSRADNSDLYTSQSQSQSQFKINGSITHNEIISSDTLQQNPRYLLITTCFYCGNSGPSSVYFRIFISSQDSNYFEYSGGKFCFQVDTTIANGGELTYEFISSDLPLHLWPQNPAVYRAKDKFILFLDRNEFPGPGNGLDLSRRGIHVADLRISTSAAELNVSGLYDSFYWRHSSDTVIATRVYSYVDSINTNITSSGNHKVDLIHPVELMDYNFNLNGNNVLLNWITIKEVNNSGFQIERSDVINYVPDEWKNIGFIEGHGTTELLSNYEFTDRDLHTGNYKYRLKQIDYNGNFEYFNLHDEVHIGIPLTYSLSQNFPNPFNPSTKISYTLPEDGFTELKIFDITGKELFKLVDEKITAGYYTVNFNGTHLPSGIYIYTLKSNNFLISKKMLLIK